MATEQNAVSGRSIKEKHNRRLSNKRQRQEAKDACRPFADQIFGHRFRQLFRDLVHEAEDQFDRLMFTRLQQECTLLNINAARAQSAEQLAELIETLAEDGFGRLHEIRQEVHQQAYAKVTRLIASCEE